MIESVVVNRVQSSSTAAYISELWILDLVLILFYFWFLFLLFLILNLGKKV